MKEANINATSIFDIKEKQVLGLTFGKYSNPTTALAIGLIMITTTPKSQGEIAKHKQITLGSNGSKYWTPSLTAGTASNLTYASASVFDKGKSQTEEAIDITFIDDIINHSKMIIAETGKKSQALDVLVKRIDSELIDGNYVVGDAFLQKFTFADFPTSFPVTILTLTLPWKQSLMERKRFYLDTKDHLTKMYSKHEDVERTLSGLE